MKNVKDNIVKSISEKTGSSEKTTDKIITEFTKILKETANKGETTVVPDIGYISIIPDKPIKSTRYSGVGKIPTAIKGKIVYKYCFPPRQHIIDELNSNKKSNEIFERFFKISSIPNKLLAEKIFEISSKTLYSYRHSEKDLPIRINEQILKLEDLFKKGIELFGSSEEVNKWLKSESYGLGNTKPIDLLNSITGIDLVYEELVRIEFGATA